jgi:hypothetical protein
VCDNLNTVLQSCAILSDWLYKARAAGVPSPKHENDVQRMQQVAQGLKSQFFPEAQ